MEPWVIAFILSLMLFGIHAYVLSPCNRESMIDEQRGPTCTMYSGVNVCRN
jgi:hypothetical protein